MNSIIQDRIAKRLLFFMILLVIIARGWIAFDEYPPSFVDEIFYGEPALVAARTGHFASPGLAVQLQEKGISGLNEGTRLVFPLPLFIRTPLIKFFGSSFQGMRLADWIILIIAVSTFYFAASALASSWRLQFATLVFLLHRLIIFSQPSRPDLIALSFGLAAFGLILHSTRAFRVSYTSNSAWLVGLLLGCSFVSHPFGGIFWSASIGAILLGSQKISRVFLMQVVKITLSGTIPVLLTSLYVFSNGAEGIAQFKWILDLKKSLFLDFNASFVGEMVQLMGRNPIIFLIILLSFKTIPCRLKKIVWALIASSICLYIWRCLRFESYNHAYIANFWAVSVIVFSLSLESLWQSNNKFSMLLHRPIGFTALIVMTLITGISSSYSPWIASLAFHHAERNRQITEVIYELIPRNAKILSSCDTYFTFDHPNKTVMAHHERMDIKQFEYIVSRNPLKQAFSNMDQWADIITPEQMKDLKNNFTQSDIIPSELLLWMKPFGLYQPKLGGLIIYRRTTLNTEYF